MKPQLLVSFFLFFNIALFAQVRQLPTRQDGTDSTAQKQPKSLRDLEKPKKDRPAIELYKIFSLKGDTTVVDTSLTIQKFYKYNYLRRDRFDLLPFANTGQTHNTLVYSFDEQHTRPIFGARARHFNYMEVGDIDYYEVPTPFTELYYKSAFQQGQALDAFFTMNTSRQFNFSIAYKGLRSLGKYQNILTSTGNFRFTFNYHGKDGRYNIKAHYVAQDLLNNENGGLTAEGLQNFAGKDSEFADRSRLEVNFEDAESILDGQRIFLDQSYELLKKKDSTQLNDNSLRIGHILNFEDKYFEYRQDIPAAIFGTSFKAADIKDRVDLLDFNNQLFIEFSNRILGKLRLQGNYENYDYGYNSVLITNDGRIPNRLSGYSMAVGAGYEKKLGGFNLNSTAEVNVLGDFDGYNLNATASYNIKDKAQFFAGITANSSPANYNHLLYQSSYSNYNWYNADTYTNIKTSSVQAGIISQKWFTATATLTDISNYAYFAANAIDSLVQSFQASENITFLKLKANKEFHLGKLSLNNTVAYQQVSSGKQFLKVPDLVTRNTLYYTDRWFDNALFIQTGVNFNYFTSYALNAYDPVLSEFYVQNETNIGDFPLIDVFFNMKVRQTRIFFIAEHINSPLGQNNFFSAPYYPYRDFNIRFGIVWNFFL